MFFLYIVNSVKNSLASCLTMNLVQSAQHNGSLFPYNKCMKYLMWWQLFFCVVTKLFDLNKNRIKLIQNTAKDVVTAILPCSYTSMRFLKYLSMWKYIWSYNEDLWSVSTRVILSMLDTQICYFFIALFVSFVSLYTLVHWWFFTSVFVFITNLNWHIKKVWNNRAKIGKKHSSNEKERKKTEKN